MQAAVTMVEALRAALHDALADDERVVVLGEDVGRLGGVFRVTDGLADAFGAHRCQDTPASEAGIVGLAVGMAMAGYRPVVEMQFDAFAYPAFEQIASHVAKMRNRTRGAVGLPMVIRVPYGGGIGAVEHHSDSSEAYYAHTAGLKVVTPATVPTPTRCCGRPSRIPTRSCSASPSDSTGLGRTSNSRCAPKGSARRWRDAPAPTPRWSPTVRP